jgi:AcrR family transcriptional regulator
MSSETVIPDRQLVKSGQGLESTAYEGMAKAEVLTKTVVTRGPHAQRTATMRQKLLEAAVDCLHTVGYAATTTQLVVETAQVSRGAFLHHFPTKVDLMLAVAEYAATYQNKYIADRIMDYGEGMDRYLALTETSWEVMRQPPAQALLEIMIAARSDPTLAERLPPVVTAFEAQQRKDVWRMARSLGIKDRRLVEVMSRLHTAAMRGIAIDLIWSGDSGKADESMSLLKYYKRRITGELMTTPPDILPPLKDGPA